MKNNKFILTRDHKQYKDIEQFKDYELTTCIAFEMAIRHPEVVKIIEQLFYFPTSNLSSYECATKLKTINISKMIKLSKILEKYYFLSYENLEHTFFFDRNVNLKQYSFINLYVKDKIQKQGNQSSTNHMLFVKPIEKCKFRVLSKEALFNYNIKSFNLRYWGTKIKQKTWTEKSNERVKGIVESMSNLSSSLSENGFSNFSNLEYKEIDGDIKLSFIDTTFSNSDISLLAYDNKFVNPYNDYPFEDDKEDIKLYPLLKDKKYIFTQEFSRPTLIVPRHLEKDISIKLNLNLPVEELITSLKSIKSIYDKEKFLFENTRNIMQKIENGTINEIIEVTPLLDKLPKEYGKHKTKQQQYSDMLFVYDALKTGMTQKAIAEELDNYHHKLSPTDPKTIRKYRDTITPYIEERKYLELYTNISMEYFKTNC